MKKIKISIVIVLSFCMMLLSVSGTFAASVYNVAGYSYNILNNSEVALCGWDNRTNELIVPSELAGRELVEVAKYGLEDNDGFSNLDFSQAKNLKTIGYGAFMNCSGIANEVVIPAQVSVIGHSAFANCSSIPSVVINGNISSIQMSTFKGCTSLESVEINGYTTSIDYQAFADCPNLNHVYIPKYVTSISALVFDNSPNVVISCYYGSCAYNYAVDNNIPYTLLDGVKLGNTSGDGSVNINDVTTIQRYLAELETLEGIYLHAADANQDGTVDISDATALQMYIAEYDLPYPIGEVMTQ